MKKRTSKTQRKVTKRRSPVKTHRKPRNVIPRTAKQYFSRTREFQETWDSVMHTISKMRSGRLSLSKAAKEFGVDPKLVKKLGGSALRRQRNGKYVAKKTDKLLRIVRLLTPEGMQEVAIRDSQKTRVIGSFWDAVQRYLQTGDSSGLEKFRGKKIVAGKKRFLLLTDTDELNRLGSAGVLSFESLYIGGRA